MIKSNQIKEYEYKKIDRQNYKLNCLTFTNTTNPCAAEVSKEKKNIQNISLHLCLLPLMNQWTVTFQPLTLTLNKLRGKK